MIERTGHDSDRPRGNGAGRANWRLLPRHSRGAGGAPTAKRDELPRHEESVRRDGQIAHVISGSNASEATLASHTPSAPPPFDAAIAAAIANLDDMALLRRYAVQRCQHSFRSIVDRHADWVYSVCLRGVKDRHLADDVVQAVFIILARKAADILPETRLSGWLFRTARFACRDAIKHRNRQRIHEARAAAQFREEVGADGLKLSGEPLCEHIAPLLDEAVNCLSEKDRQAIMLRFYEGHSLREVGVSLGISEEAAKKRVTRAVEKMRNHFSRRGVAISIPLLLIALAGLNAEAAPAALAAALAGVGTNAGSGAMLAGAAGVSSLPVQIALGASRLATHSRM